MTSPTCQKCDCVKGCQADPSPCPILLAQCIASGQVNAAQIEAHRVLDAIVQPVEPTIVTADTSKVICPACVHQFRAIPQDVQSLMLDAGFEPPFVVAAKVAQQASMHQPLTHTEIVDAYNESMSDWVFEKDNPYMKFARAIEAKHGITTPKETK